MNRQKAVRLSGSILKYAAILLLFAFLLFPVYWMLATSLKMNTESYRMVPTLFPQTISWEGYKTLFDDGKFLVYYGNNVIVSALAAVIICVISVMAGYALSRFHFPVRNHRLLQQAYAGQAPCLLPGSLPCPSLVRIHAASAIR